MRCTPNTIGWISRELGLIERALRWDERALAESREGGWHGPFKACANSLLNLATDLTLHGRLDEAATTLDQAAEAVERHNYMRWRTENRLTLCRGELALARGDGVQALALAEDAMGQASPHGATKYMHLAHDLAGRAPATLGKTEEAMIRLEQAVMGAAAIEYRAGHWCALAHLADVLEHAGQVAAAEDRRAAARAVIGTIAQGMRDPDSCTAFLAATSVPAALTHPAR